MQVDQIISIYTILYLCITYLGIILQGNIVISLLREGYLIALFFFLVSTQYKKLYVNKFHFYLDIYIVLNIYAVLKSANKSDAFLSFLMFMSGPLLFLLLSSFSFNKRVYQQTRRRIKFLFSFFVLTSLVLYPFQEQFCALINHDPKMLYRWGRDGHLWMRLGGLCLHPTTMGAVSIFLIINLWLIKERKKIFISLLSYYYTNTRTVLLGIPFAFFSYQSRKKKILLILLASILLIGGVWFFFNFTFDPSALIHFADVFVKGPLLVWENKSLFGIGHGMMSPYTLDSPFIHLESDFYITLMQVGYLGFFVYFVLCIGLIRVLKRDSNVYARYCLYIFFIYNVGCIFFPLNTIRFISNYVWIELGLYFSYRRSLCW